MFGIIHIIVACGLSAIKGHSPWRLRQHWDLPPHPGLNLSRSTETWPAHSEDARNLILLSNLGCDNPCSRRLSQIETQVAKDSLTYRCSKFHTAHGRVTVDVGKRHKWETWGGANLLRIMRWRETVDLGSWGGIVRALPRNGRLGELGCVTVTLGSWE